MAKRQKRFSLCDMHCHLLPGIDDGCQTVEESLRVLEMCMAQGIERVAATPHYYSDLPVAEFLEQRQQAWECLRAAMDPEKNYPEITLGAEVAYHSALVCEDRLADLCYQGTPYLLLEMPFGKWTPNILRDVESLRGSFGITPVIAHIERYFRHVDKARLRELMQMDVLIQCNAAFLLDGGLFSPARRMLKAGNMDLLGSDCHGMRSRRENLGPAKDRILSWGLDEALRRIGKTSVSVLSGELL